MSDILKLANQCGAINYSPPPMRAVRGVSLTFEQLEEFAARIRAEALEEAAKIADDKSAEWFASQTGKDACIEIASAIRNSKGRE